MRDNAVRGKILDFLKHVYPEGADDRFILSIFYQYHRAEALEQALEYLFDKTYITRKEVPHPYHKGELIKVYKIAPAGIDLLDGLTQDPGVSIYPEED
jgi:hypothetical protein